ncbi:hypothetical protein Ancab_006693 [Ancistrocladus abbreviatus]
MLSKAHNRNQFDKSVPNLSCMEERHFGNLRRENGSDDAVKTTEEEAVSFPIVHRQREVAHNCGVDDFDYRKGEGGGTVQKAKGGMGPLTGSLSGPGSFQSYAKDVSGSSPGPS